MNSDEKLPSDMVFEVLSRTNLETLDTCKAVSKTWKQLIYESSFTPEYLKRSNNIFGYFMQDFKHLKHVHMFVSADLSETGAGSEGCSSWPGDDVRILASSNQGLLCCERKAYKNNRCYIGKPATRQWQPLPNPKLRYMSDAVAMVVYKSKPLHYKIVRLSTLKVNAESMVEFLCEIFDSKTWKWRTAEAVRLPFCDAIMSDQPAVTVGEFAYWRTLHNKVLAFDLTREGYHIFSLPEPILDNAKYTNKRLMEYEGGLGLSCSTGGGKRMELWVMKGEWRKKMAVDMSSIGETSFKYAHPVGFCNSEVVFMRTDFESVFYKAGDGSVKAMGVHWIYAREVFQFRSDMECVDLRGG